MAVSQDVGTPLEISYQPASPHELRIRKRIRETLRDYGTLTVSMIGPHIRPYDPTWRIYLEQMVAEGEVIRKAVVKPTKVGVRTTYVLQLAGESSSAAE